MLKMFGKTDAALHYEIVPPERYQDVVDFMAGDFWQDEPNCKAVGAAVGGLEEMRDYTLKGLQYGMSHMAVDLNTGNIVGVAVNSVAKKTEDPDAMVKSTKDESFRKVFVLNQEINTINLFEKYNIDEIFYVDTLSTARNYRLRGIATELLHLGVELAKSLGYKVAKSQSSGVYSQSAYRRAGYTAVREIFYNDYIVDGEVVFKNMEEIHPSLQLFVQILH